MEWLLFILVYGIVGTIIGRILFRLRLGNKSRYAIEKVVDQYDVRTNEKTLANTFDMSSAQTYGLWSLPLWPLTLAVFLIQAPTPAEKQTQKEIELKELLDKADAMTRELRR